MITDVKYDREIEAEVANKLNQLLLAIKFHYLG